MKMGIEMEFWVVDERGQPCDGSDLAEAHDRLEPEFVGPLVEAKTAAHESEFALAADLGASLSAAIRAADRSGRRLVPLGTPLTAVSPPAVGHRGRLLETLCGDGIQSAKNCAGTHVHFEKGDALGQLNLLTALDPALALVSSSPYYCGRRTRTAARPFAYRTERGIEFDRFCELWRYAESVHEWDARVDDAYDEFERLAWERGIPSTTIRERFEPEDVVLTPVRHRRSIPTVEWRAPDTALPSQILKLVADVAGVVRCTETATVEIGEAGVHMDRIGIPPFSTLSAVSEAAIEHGLASRRVVEYLRSFGIDATAYRPITDELRGPSVIGESDACDIRLEYARRLRADVAELATVLPSGAVDGRIGRRASA